MTRRTWRFRTAGAALALAAFGIVAVAPAGIAAAAVPSSAPASALDPSPTNAATAPDGAAPSGGDAGSSEGADGSGTAPADDGAGTSTSTDTPTDPTPTPSAPAPAPDPTATPSTPTSSAPPAAAARVAGETTAAAAPVPLPLSTWAATTSPADGQVLLQGDPAAIDYAVDIAWKPSAEQASAIRGYRIELFSGRTVTNSNTLIARGEVDASTGTATSLSAPAAPATTAPDAALTPDGALHYRVEAVGFTTTTVTARITALDGAQTLSSPLVSTPLTLPSASSGTSGTARAGTPTLSAPTADGFTATWTAAATGSGDPAPAGYVLRVLERRHDQLAATANTFIATTLDVGDATTATVTGLHGSSRYLAAAVAYDLVDGAKHFRTASATSTAPAWSSSFAAETLGARPPAIEWSNRPAAPTASSARVVTWQGSAVTDRYTGGSPITAYRVQLYEVGAGLVTSTDVAVDASATDPALTPTVAFRALTPGARYSVRVAAINAAGVGELSDFSPAVTTPHGSEPGSRPPAFTDRAAVAAAIAAGTLAETAPAAGAAVEQGDEVTLDIPWSTTQSGEAWLFGDATFLRSVTTRAGSGTDAAALTVATTGLPLGDHWVLFLTDDELDGATAPADGAAVAVRITVVASTAGIMTLDDAVLRWAINDESNNGAYFGGCNYLSAGRTPDPGGSVIFSRSQYSASSGTVSIEKPDASGRYVPATWETKCLDRTGANLSSGTATPYGGNQFVITGGTGEVDRSTGSARIQWHGDVTVAYYGGMTFWYLSDPVLTITNGAGTLTATLGGFGTDMDNLTKWQPIADRTVTLATFAGAQVGADGFAVTPDYRGVAVDLASGQTPQSRSGADWGSFPQGFIDFQSETGQAAYWYSSGGQADGAKPAQPVIVGYDAATFTAPTAPAPAETDKASVRTPVAKLPPAKLPMVATAAAPALAAEAAAASGAIDQAFASSVTIIEQQASATALSDEELVLLLALVALLGLIVVITGVGGGLVLLGRTAPAAG